MRGYSRGFRTTLLGVLIALFASGCLLLPTTLVMRLEWDMVWRLSAGTRIGMAALHVAAAFAGLVLFGSLWTFHMRAGWRQHRNRRNGVVLVGVLIVLSVTSLGIFYLADERLSLYAALVHTAFGLILPACFIYHMVMGQRLARRINSTQQVQTPPQTQPQSLAPAPAPASDWKPQEPLTLLSSTRRTT